MGQLFGLETVSTGRTLDSCGTASKELHLKFFTGGEIKGPAAKPDFTQVATLTINVPLFKKLRDIIFFVGQ